MKITRHSFKVIGDRLYFHEKNKQVDTKKDPSVAIVKIAGKKLPIFARIKQAIAKNIFRRRLYTKYAFKMGGKTKFAININSLAKLRKSDASKLRKIKTPKELWKKHVFPLGVKYPALKAISKAAAKAGLKQSLGKIQKSKSLKNRKVRIFGPKPKATLVENTTVGKTNRLTAHYLASGSFKDVYEMQNQALSIIKKKEDYEYEKAVKEVIEENKILSKFDSKKDHIAAPAKEIVYFKSGEVGFLSPLYRKPNALDLIKNTNPEQRKSLFKWIAMGAAIGVQSMHNCRDKTTPEGIVHRDIKPQNIFIEIDKEKALLGDAGRAIEVHKKAPLSGTPNYTPPDLFPTALVTSYVPDLKKVDIYSLGMTFYRLLEGKFPEYKDKPYGCQAPNNLDFCTDEVYPKAEKGSIQKLIRDMISWDPKKRPTADEVVQRLTIYASE